MLTLDRWCEARSQPAPGAYLLKSLLASTESYL